MSRRAAAWMNCSASSRANSFDPTGSNWPPEAAVKRHRVLIPNALASEDVQRRADRQVDSPLPHSRDRFQVRQRTGAAGIGDGSQRPLPEFFDQFQIHSLTQPLNIDGVNEKLGASRGEAPECFL